CAQLINKGRGIYPPGLCLFLFPSVTLLTAANAPFADSDTITALSGRIAHPVQSEAEPVAAVAAVRMSSAMMYDTSCVGIFLSASFTSCVTMPVAAAQP